MSTTTDERVRILRMVADATITPAEADDLLSALEPAPSTAHASIAGPAFASHPSFNAERAPGMSMGHTMMTRPPAPYTRSLVLFISEEGETKVNIRIPLSLARTAGRFIPRRAQEYLNDYDIHVDRILEDIGSVNFEGPLVEIQDEETQIRIGIE